MTQVGRLLRAAKLEERSRILEQLGGGSAKDYSEYQFLVGFLAGMDRLIERLDEIEVEGR